MKHVDKALQLLWYYWVFIKCSKFSFEVFDFEHLGDIVGKYGVRVEPKNIAAIQ